MGLSCPVSFPSIYAVLGLGQSQEEEWLPEFVLGTTEHRHDLLLRRKRCVFHPSTRKYRLPRLIYLRRRIGGYLILQRKFHFFSPVFMQSSFREMNDGN